VHPQCFDPRTGMEHDYKVLERLRAKGRCMQMWDETCGPSAAMPCRQAAFLCLVVRNAGI